MICFDGISGRLGGASLIIIGSGVGIFFGIWRIIRGVCGVPNLSNNKNYR